MSPILIVIALSLISSMAMEKNLTREEVDLPSTLPTAGSDNGSVFRDQSIKANLSKREYLEWQVDIIVEGWRYEVRLNFSVPFQNALLK